MRFDVGDRVVIRDWDDMEAEFGCDDYGNIMCDKVFLDEMRFLCGQEFVIEQIDIDNESVVFEGDQIHYCIGFDMIRSCENPDEELSMDDFMAIISL